MKKILFTLIISMVVLVLASCVNIKNNDSLAIKLKGNPTTGYQWKYRISDESILKLTKEEYKTSRSARGAVGVGGEYTFVFKGISTGETDVVFNYLREWEGSPIETKTVHFVFDGTKLLSDYK